jgi:hypothetical protein
MAVSAWMLYDETMSSSRSPPPPVNTDMTQLLRQWMQQPHFP